MDQQIRFRRTITDSVERARRLSLLFQIFEQKKLATDSSLAADSVAKKDKENYLCPHPYSTRKSPKIQVSNAGNPAPTLTNFFEDIPDHAQPRMFDLPEEISHE